MKYRAELPETPDGWGTLYIDPPWALAMGGGQRKLKYDTMTTEDIIAMGPSLTAITRPDSHLWLWTTNPHLPEAIDVLRAWGWTYKTTLTWDKERLGLGWWLRSKTEHCLWAVREKGKRVQQPGPMSTVIRGGYRGHSRKPLAMYEVIELYSPGPYLELFASPEGRTRRMWARTWSQQAPYGDPYGDGIRPEHEPWKGCPRCQEPELPIKESHPEGDEYSCIKCGHRMYAVMPDVEAEQELEEALV